MSSGGVHILSRARIIPRILSFSELFLFEDAANLDRLNPIEKVQNLEKIYLEIALRIKKDKLRLSCAKLSSS